MSKVLQGKILPKPLKNPNIVTVEGNGEDDDRPPTPFVCDACGMCTNDPKRCYELCEAFYCPMNHYY
jgi:hypothetical protein